MRRVHVGCEFVHEAGIDTPSVVQVMAVRDEGVTITDERWSIDPAQDGRTYSDPYGNECLRLIIPAGRSTFRYDAIAVVPDATEDVDVTAPEITPIDLPYSPMSRNHSLGREPPRGGRPCRGPEP